MNIRCIIRTYAHSGSAVALASGAWARRSGVAGRLIFLLCAAPDGHTLFLGNSGVMTSNPALYARLPYDPVKEFAPVSLIAAAPLLLVAHPSLQVSTVTQLVSLARARPGQLTFASGGAGGVAHLAGELLNSILWMWTPDEKTRQRILVTNPAQLYGFLQI